MASTGVPSSIPGFVAEGSWREQPVGPAPQGLTERPVCPPVKVSGAKQNIVQRELAGLLRRLSRQSCGASSYEHCLRSLGVNALKPGSLQPLGGLRRLMWEAGYPAAGCCPATA